MDDSINNRNSKTTRFNVAPGNKMNCLIICEKPGHVAKNCYMIKAQRVVSNKQNRNFVIQNLQRNNNYPQEENKNNNIAKNNYPNN